MTESSRPSRQKRGYLSNPMAIFGAGLLVAQLVIFNIGLSVFHTSNNIHTESLNTFQRVNRKRQSKRKKYSGAKADGYFNGYPLNFRQAPEPATLPHCVGENYQEGHSWQHRSCMFQFFCFDTSIKDFVVFQSPEEEKIYKMVENRPLVDVGQSYLKPGANRSNAMSLGGINLKWGTKDDGVPRLKWFPEIRRTAEHSPLSYYELPSSVVMIPFHSMNGANPGHLVWDDFLPIYTLLSMYQFEEDSDLLMMRYILKDGRGLWASCDFKDSKNEACEKMHKKFLPLMMGTDPVHTLTTTENFSLELNGDSQSNLICARHGVAGIGALTDHGPTKLHGWEEDDYKTTHNHGRGGMLFEFRNFMMSNLGLETEYTHSPPFRIVFSEKSSDIPTRYIDFSRQADLLRKSFNPEYVKVESYVFKDIPLVEQVEIASQATIYITGAGGGAVTASFLPRGASVFLYFLENGGLKGGRETFEPARLDWDLFNNLGYLKVHWLPKGSMNHEADLRSLVLLVQHELDALMRERSYDKFFY